MSNLSSVDPDRLREIAVEAARTAGRFLLAERPDEVLVAATKSTPTDVVTVMDVAAERLVADLIREHRPHDAFVGEEGSGELASGGEGDAPDGGSAASGSRVQWVVDPLDGTVNYLYGIPSFAVSIAAEVDGVAVAGAVVNPVLGETFHAVRGGGAWLGDTRLTVSAVTDLGHALVGTGFAYDPARRAAQARAVSAVLPRARDVRRLGVASLDLCSVAAGRLDAFYERGLQHWDHAAGLLIAAEAGATVGGLRGARAGEELVVAAAPGVFDELHELLVGARADEDG